MAFANEVGQRAFAHRAAEKVAKQFAGALVRQELIVLEVHGHGLDAGAVCTGALTPSAALFRWPQEQRFISA